MTSERLFTVLPKVMFVIWKKDFLSMVLTENVIVQIQGTGSVSGNALEFACDLKGEMHRVQAYIVE